MNDGFRVSAFGHVARTVSPRVMPGHGGLAVRPTAPKPVSLAPGPWPLTPSSGFTLVEIVVAVAIFMILMSGLFMVFTGVMKTVPQTNQASDAFERARGALSIIQDDLLNSYNSSDHSDIEAFYGTPIGFTFIGNTKVIDSTTTTADTNIARITYVVYNPSNDIAQGTYAAQKADGSPNINPCTITTANPQGTAYQDADQLVTTTFSSPEGLLDVNGNILVDGNGNPVSGYTYVLLRYVEPGVNNLDTFPINWNNAQAAAGLAAIIAEQQVYALAQGIVASPDELNKTARRQFWIRALAGGDQGDQVADQNGQLVPSAPVPVPNAWDLNNGNGIWTTTQTLCMIPSHYLLTENVLSPIPPQARFQKAVPPSSPQAFQNVGNWWGQQSFQSILSGGQTPEVNVAFFNYGNMFEVGLDTTTTTTTTDPDAFQSNEDSGLSTTQSSYGWWDDYQCADSGGWPLINGSDPHLPPLVNVSFWLMFEKTNLSAPDFKRAFGMRIFLPAGYQRGQTYSP